jgi:hypothetical protein
LYTVKSTTNVASEITAIASSTRRAHRPSQRIIFLLSTSVQNILELRGRLRNDQTFRSNIQTAIAFSVNPRVNARKPLD